MLPDALENETGYENSKGITDMNLFEITMNVVPFLFISLFLDLPRFGGRAGQAEKPERGRGRIETLFDLVVATLGLLAFMVSLYAIGSQPDHAPEPWMRQVVIVALSFAMAALFSRVLMRIFRANSPMRI